MMMNTGKKHNELMKSLAVILVLLLSFGGVIPVFAVTEGIDEQLTVTQSVYDNGNGGGNEEEDFTILYTGVADVERYYHPSNTVCDENKIEDPTSGSVELGDTGKFFNYEVVGNELTWSVDEGIHITAVSVKGGQQNAGFNYFYTEAVSGDSGLHANVKNNSPQGISHISFCWDVVVDDDPEETASLTIIKELFDEDDEMIETSDENFQVLINDSDDEEFWLGNISVDEGFSDDEMELDTYFIKENVDDKEFTVTYWMGETELTPDENGFVEVDLTEDGADVTIVIQNRPVVDDDEEPAASLTILKELFDQDDELVEVSDEPFEVLINNSDKEEFWLGDISVDEGFSDDEMELDTYFIKENVDDEEFTVIYWIGETELTPDEDGFVDVDLTEDGADVTIIIQNRPVVDDEDDDEDPVDDPDDDDDPVDDPDDDEDPVDDPDNDGEETITVTTDSTPAGGGGTPAVATTTIIEDPVVPLAAPEVEVVDPVIILDEPIPLAPPVLPQTGDSNPLNYSLAGLLLMAVGFIFRKRLAA